MPAFIASKLDLGRRRVLLFLACFSFLVLLLLGSHPTSRSYLSHSKWLAHISSSKSSFGPGRWWQQSTSGTSRLHFLIPATNSNKNFCHLLLSAIATRFPPPVLINWGAEIDADPYKVHMGKVKGILDYLDRIILEDAKEGEEGPASNDLVLILDGFDIWLQLPPDILIQRYYSVIDAANDRLARELGGTHIMEKHGIYQSVLFGPDKVCWPEDAVRTACWAVPNSTLPQDAFGPDTDADQWRHLSRPRWLNSGTIMGPVRDVRRFFQATHDRITNFYTVDSDQFYMADLWGTQEYWRQKISDRLPPSMTRNLWIHEGYMGEGHYEEKVLQEPEIQENQQPEYHITIDYESELFQTVAYYDRFLSWTPFKAPSNNRNRPLHRSPNTSSPSPRTRIQKRNSFPELPYDILDTERPFQHIDAHSKLERGPERQVVVPSDLEWDDLLLGRNVASGKIWALIHFTPPKFWLELWWFRMWYAPYAEAMIRHAPPTKGDQLLTVTQDGRKWYPYMPDLATDIPAGGAHTDSREALDWGQLCGRVEDFVITNAPEPPIL